MRIQEPAAEYIVDKKGHKKAVLLSVKQYDQLMEDLHDLSLVAERKNEKNLSLEEMKRRLKKA
jgi:PHD/YefM family antitoxin component YafN of YafNO toxin-antitoxin module